MIEVQFDCGKVREALDDLVSKLNGRGRRKLFKEIGATAANQMKRNFVYGGIEPNKWKPNSASTVERKQLSGKKGNWTKSGRLSAKGHRRVARNQVLVDAGNLRQISFKVVDDGVLIGSDRDYGKFHLPPEKSGHPSKNVMPVRDWLDFDEKGYERIENAIIEEIEEALNGR